MFEMLIYAIALFESWRNLRPNGDLVVKVVDGDTIRTKKEVIRLARVDAPESSALRFGYIERGGVEAKEALRRKLEGKRVKVKRVGVCKYGRTVAEVYLGRQNVSDWLLKNGFSRTYGRK